MPTSLERMPLGNGMLRWHMLPTSVCPADHQRTLPGDAQLLSIWVYSQLLTPQAQSQTLFCLIPDSACECGERAIGLLSQIP